jgi:drug/metabolite transporter (DMT)-like permease
MIALAVGAALVAAVLHGTWNVLVKVGGDPIATFRRSMPVAAAVATLSLIPAWLILGRPSLTPMAVVLCAVSSVLEAVYLWLLSAAYRRGDLSAVYPIARGSAPLLSVLVGLVILGERLSGAQLAGVGLLLVGILSVTVSQARGRGTVLALLTGVAIASYSSVDRVAVRMATPWLYAWLLFAMMAVALAVSIWIASRTGLYRAADPLRQPTWRQAAVIGTFIWAGYFLVLWAFSVAPLAIVAPVRETAIVAVAVWGVWRLRERQGAPMKVLGALAALVGVALLAV